MKTLKQEYDEFEQAVEGFIDGVLPRIRELLAAGLAVSGAIQRNKDNSDLRLEMAFHVLHITSPEQIKMKEGKQHVNDFVRALMGNITTRLEMTETLACHVSPVAEVQQYYLMSWFLMCKQEGECPKSLH